MQSSKCILENVNCKMQSTGCPKKRGISECRSVCSSAQLMLSLKFLFPIHLKIEIQTCTPSTEPFLSDIRKLRNTFFKYLI